MPAVALKNVILSEKILNNMHEHIITLRSDFQSIASAAAQKNTTKLPITLFDQIKKSYDSLSEKLLAQPTIEVMKANINSQFKRVHTRITK